jgi:CubicO group peptidase (beta-lactamase class C family)
VTFQRSFAAVAIATMLSASIAAAAPVPPRRLGETRSLVTQSVDRLIAVKGGIAGYSVVIAAEGEPDFILTRGQANAETGQRVTPDTAFYVASMTKPFVGLLAARLDREGVLPLRTSLAEIWPGLVLPAPLRSQDITLDMLLSHRAGFDNEPLGERTAYIDEVLPATYPRLLRSASSPTAVGFRYSNVGYLIYSAALAERTRRDWKAWLALAVLSPLGLRQTYSRSSLIPRRDLAWGHRWSGASWIPLEPKPDAIMHAAGGLFLSSRDAARWMRLQISDGKGQSALHTQDFQFTRSDRSGGGLGEGDHGISCDGYGLGWSLCTFQGTPLLYHGGSYEGIRTHMFDGMTGGLGQEFMAVIASSLLGRADSQARAETMVAGYGARVARQIENRLKAVAESEADPQWDGWRWAPDELGLRSYEGVYHSDLYGDLEVRLSGGSLVASHGVVQRVLRPAMPNRFAARADAVSPWSPVAFEVTAGGAPAAVTFQNRRFERSPAR